MNKDLTVGNPRSVLWRFCLPLFGSVIFQQLYNMADSLVAGKFDGEQALAAVSNSYDVTMVFLAFAFGVNIGCSVVVSRFFGAKDYRNVKTTVSTVFISVAVLCTVLMILGFSLSPSLMKLIGTPESVRGDCLTYLYIYIAGLFFLFFYNTSTGIFTAMGDSRTPFIFLALSSTGNIFMDILFVKEFHMGVAGVAWATFICQGISCILAVVFLLRRLRGMAPDEKAPLFSFSIFKTFLVISIPSVLQQSFISIGNLFVQSFVNSFESEAIIAGYGAATKLNVFAIASFVAIGNGMSNFTSQNLGAGKPERIGKGFSAGLSLVYLVCLPVFVLFFFFGNFFVGLFMNENATQEALQTGIDFLRIVSPFYILISSKLITDGVLRGSGAMTLFMIDTCLDLILRVVLAYFFHLEFGVQGIWWSWPIGWALALISAFTFYFTGMWKRKVKKITE